MEVGFSILKERRMGLVLLDVGREVEGYWLGLAIDLLLRWQEPRL